jgi:hypothetical protein
MDFQADRSCAKLNNGRIGNHSHDWFRMSFHSCRCVAQMLKTTLISSLTHTQHRYIAREETMAHRGDNDAYRNTPLPSINGERKCERKISGLHHHHHNTAHQCTDTKMCIAHLAQQNRSWSAE